MKLIWRRTEAGLIAGNNGLLTYWVQPARGKNGHKTGYFAYCKRAGSETFIFGAVWKDTQKDAKEYCQDHASKNRG